MQCRAYEHTNTHRHARVSKTILCGCSQGVELLRNVVERVAGVNVDAGARIDNGPSPYGIVVLNFRLPTPAQVDGDLEDNCGREDESHYEDADTSADMDGHLLRHHKTGDVLRREHHLALDFGIVRHGALFEL